MSGLKHAFSVMTPIKHSSQVTDWHCNSIRRFVRLLLTVTSLLLAVILMVSCTAKPSLPSLGWNSGPTFTCKFKFQTPYDKAISSSELQFCANLRLGQLSRPRSSTPTISRHAFVTTRTTLATPFAAGDQKPRSTCVLRRRSCGRHSDLLRSTAAVN